MSLAEDLERWVLVRLNGLDFRNRWFAVGRTTMAVASLTVLLFTPIAALTVPVGGSRTTQCGNVRAASVLCIGDPAQFVELRRWVLIVMLGLVAIGFAPRVTGPLHAWATFSIGGSITLPDGGDAIAATMSLLLLPLCIADGRLWHWTPPRRPLATSWVSVMVVAELGVRLQLAFIYLDSAISKFSVDDWSNGTAEYYILRDSSFGDQGVLHGLFVSITATPLGTLCASWGAIVIEIAIGATLLLSWRWRLLGLALDVALHLGIILTMGLVSFSLVMIGASVIAANPLGRSDELVGHLRRRPPRPGQQLTSTAST